MADEIPLTPTEDFVVKRLATKVGAAKHHLFDAARAAAVLPPEMLVRCGMREALATLERELDQLRACIYPPPKTEEVSVG